MNRDEDALNQFIDGQNDAIDLLTPQSQDYYYLLGWQDAKRKLASGELCWVYEKQQEPSRSDDDDWEEF